MSFAEICFKNNRLDRIPVHESVAAFDYVAHNADGHDHIMVFDSLVLMGEVAKYYDPKRN